MDNTGRRSDLFRRMLRQHCSPMHSGIAVVALPRLDDRFVAAARRGGAALSRMRGAERDHQFSWQCGCGSVIQLRSGRVSVSNPG